MQSAVPEGLTPDSVLVVQAPARVNLVGEHTDYTGGLVMPMAIPFRTTATISQADEPRYRFESEGFAERREVAIDDRSARAGNWADYPVGVLRQLQAIGIEPPPFDLHLSGNVPLGSGLSSSASVEVASALAMLMLAGKSLSEADVATLCQRAENDYVGSPCGIMDQFVVTAAQAKHALLLHTRTLEYELIPFDRGDLRDACVVICNSMVKHSIAGGEYGQRRRELEEGQAAIVKAFAGVRDLGEATLEQLEACKESMSAESYRRVRHIITENARVVAAKEAMLSGDARAMGEIMVGSHVSQREDFECSTEEIDFLVETALTLDGCYGSRLTGGGFGGCTVSLVQKAKSEAFATALRTAYRNKFGIEAQVYFSEAVDGALRTEARVMKRELERGVL
jgi:galactokinase